MTSQPGCPVFNRLNFSTEEQRELTREWFQTNANKSQYFSKINPSGREKRSPDPRRPGSPPARLNQMF
jgi:hypothetical protein